MGILDNLFGGGGKHYSHSPHSLNREEIRRLISRERVRTLSEHEEQAVEDAIDSARHGDGHISMKQIYETLKKLEREHRISSNDRKGLMQVFEEHFGEV
ncbi:MAG: hypothetical protein AAB932_03010 [Patescibacteria group bacterium]